ncbi:unnamed protein product [Rotaria magnacalcarata]|nr:unnamed protein product [Rotaria magnacalcarata]
MPMLGATMTTECHHTFHLKCIAQNAKRNNNICPICRTKIEDLVESQDAIVTGKQSKNGKGFPDKTDETITPWECSFCTYLNNRSENICEICFQLRPAECSVKSAIRSPDAEPKEKTFSRCQDSKCHTCNPQSEHMCAQCLLQMTRESDEPSPPPSVAPKLNIHHSEHGSKVPPVGKRSAHWECQTCTYHNSYSNAICEICSAEMIPRSLAVSTKLGMLHITCPKIKVSKLGFPVYCLGTLFKIRIQADHLLRHQ